GVDFSGVSDKSCARATFRRACLVNANLTGANLTDDTGGRLPMTQACLQGADFTSAHIENADLTGSAVATVSGQLTATIKHGWPLTTQNRTLYYDPTVNLTDATSDQTVCPDTEYGPCTPSTFIPDGPSTWPVTSPQRPAGPGGHPRKPPHPGRHGR
ncbi:MAG: pentapeptide repeat-containing protein, partial [Actinoplanes sp.]